MNKKILSILLIVMNICVTKLFSQVVFPVNEIIKNGDNSSHINIVFLSEGYTLDEMDKFSTDVNKATNDIMNQSPYSFYQSCFNVYSIEVPSNESGTNHPNTASDCGTNSEEFYADTYFNSTFDSHSIHRLLVVKNTNAVSLVLRFNIPDWDIVFIIVNHSMYGGSGGTYATFSTNNASSEVAIHELGHSFARLADEYWAGEVYAHEAANMTQESNPDLVKWSNWMNDYNIGIYEHSSPGEGWYRPHQSCKMRLLGVPFCAVCSEKTVTSIYNLINTIESYEPESTTFTINRNDSVDLKIQTRIPSNKSMKVEWNLDNNLIDVESDSFCFDASTVDIGNHQIQATVIDTTPKVRNDLDNLLSSSITWDIKVISTTGLDNQDNDLVKKYALNDNFPNPFNNTTTISYQLPKLTNVKLSIYDINGQFVKLLVNQQQIPGLYKVKWEAVDIPSGIYFYKIVIDNFVEMNKCILLK